MSGKSHMTSAIESGRNRRTFERIPVSDIVRTSPRHRHSKDRDNGDGVIANGLIDSGQCQTVLNRLSDEHTVEGVAIVSGQTRQVNESGFING